MPAMDATSLLTTLPSRSGKMEPRSAPLWASTDLPKMARLNAKRKKQTFHITVGTSSTPLTPAGPTATGKCARGCLLFGIIVLAIDPSSDCTQTTPTRFSCPLSLSHLLLCFSDMFKLKNKLKKSFMVGVQVGNILVASSTCESEVIHLLL